MRYPAIITAVAAILAATAQGASLLDSVLTEESPASIPAPTEETGTNEVPADEPVKVEEQAGSADDEDVQKLREEVASLRQELDRQTSEVLANENDRPIASKPQGHIVNPATLYIRGGGGDKCDGAFSLEGMFPLGKYPFDISLRGFILALNKVENRSDTETYYTYSWRYSRKSGWYQKSRRHTRTYYYTDRVDQRNTGGEALCIWRPFRGKPFSPYVGVGIRYEDIPDGKGFEETKPSTSLAGRFGVLLDLKRVFITGEYVAGDESSELIGDISFYITRRCKLHAFVESIDLDLEKAVVGGGGLSFDF